MNPTLGMAVVWGTVEDHHGHIEVKSVAGEGSQFALYFPPRLETGALTSIESFIIEKYIGNEQVLIVDDLADQRDIAASLVEKLGYPAVAVSSGEAAIEFLKNNRMLSASCRILRSAKPIQCIIIGRKPH